MATDSSRSDTSSESANAGGEGGAPSQSRLFIPCATVFASSFCVMVIELVAGRIIAGTLGSSLYTWTSVIGIVLAGLAIGNYAGGLLADRFDTRRTLTALFIASSAAALTISISDDVAATLQPLWSMSWPLRVASHVALVFFVPSCLLGTISPVAAKMALDLGHATGRTIGSVYAWGVVGSILGTFATGFYLVAVFGTTAITIGVAMALAILAVCYQVRSWKTWAWAGAVAAVAVVMTNAAEAARTAPDLADAYNNWGQAPRLLGDDESVLLRFGQALEVAPGHPDASRSLAHLRASLDSSK